MKVIFKGKPESIGVGKDHYKKHILGQKLEVIHESTGFVWVEDSAGKNWVLLNEDFSLVINYMKEIDNINKWIYALNNTVQDQCKGKLGDNYGYCAEGIGCLAVGVDFKSTDKISQEFRDKVGMKNTCIINVLNDKGLSFKEIASFILDHPEKVFYEDVVEALKHI